MKPLRTFHFHFSDKNVKHFIIYLLAILRSSLNVSNNCLTYFNNTLHCANSSHKYLLPYPPKFITVFSFVFLFKKSLWINLCRPYIASFFTGTRSIHQEIHSERTVSPTQQLTIGNTSSARGGVFYPTPSSMQEFGLTWACILYTQTFLISSLSFLFLPKFSVLIPMWVFIGLFY